MLCSGGRGRAATAAAPRGPSKTDRSDKFTAPMKHTSRIPSFAGPPGWLFFPESTRSAHYSAYNSPSTAKQCCPRNVPLPACPPVVGAEQKNATGGSRAPRGQQKAQEATSKTHRGSFVGLKYRLIPSLGRCGAAASCFRARGGGFSACCAGRACCGLAGVRARPRASPRR